MAGFGIIGFVAGTLAVGPACTGSIGEGEAGPSSVDTERGPGPSGAGAENPSDPNKPVDLNRPNTPAATCTPSPVRPAPVRRLSQTEYQASLRDLLPSLAPLAPTIGKDTADKGFENRALLLNPTPLLVEQYGTSAVDAAIKAVGKLSSILPCTPTPATEAACGRQFITTFGARAFRRPLTTQETDAYVAFFEGRRAASNFAGAVQLTLEVMLQSPQFLYRLEFGEPATAAPDKIKLSPYEIATRLSYLLWGSPPDDVLFAAAQGSQLDLPAQREVQARRMLADPRAKGMLIDFHRAWLEFDRITEKPEAKAATLYPTYNDTLKAAIREESNRFVEDIMWQGDGTLASFLTSPKTQVNAPLAALYGVPAPASGWAPVDLKPTERAGFLTRANFLTARAHKISGSPPLRAVYILERLFCITPPVAPPDADLSEPKSSAGNTLKTNRQLFEERVAPPPCNACHAAINPMGYGLENYDAIGRYRTKEENGLTIDASGTFTTVDVTGSFADGVELSQKIAGSAQVRACVVGEWYQFAAGRNSDAGDQCRIDKLKQVLAASGGNIRELLVAIAASPEFAFRPPVQ